MTGAPLRLVAVSAGVRSPSSTRSLADAVVDAVADAVRRHPDDGSPDVQRQTVEVRDHALDAASAALTGTLTDDLAAAVAAVEAADVLVVATPVYNGSYTGLFKSFTDLVRMDALVGTPAVLAATGGSARHALVVETELRPLLAVLQATTVPTGVFAAAADWAGPGRPGPDLAARISRAGAEAAALVRVRPELRRG